MPRIGTTSYRGMIPRRVADWGAVTDNSGGTAGRSFGAPHSTIYNASSESNWRASMADIFNDARTGMIAAGLV